MEYNYINYYELLGVTSTSSVLEIEMEFKNAVKKYHPDKQGNNESSTRLFQYINDARNVLSDPLKRKTYDELLGINSNHKNSLNNNAQFLSQSNQNNGGAILIVGLLRLWIGSALSDCK
ncbi:MAG: J domain-containing protein [Saprospiraceae bacterium]|nr:J domain-containing protein [Saprospiraceae bacterium]